MNYSLGKGIRFFTEDEVRDAMNVADRLFTKDLLIKKEKEDLEEVPKMDYWQIYASYVIMLLILSYSYREMADHNVPTAQVSEVKYMLGKSPRKIKEFILSSCLVYLPYSVYVQILPILLKVLSTRKHEFISILEEANHILDDFFGDEFRKS